MAIDLLLPAFMFAIAMALLILRVITSGSFAMALTAGIGKLLGTAI